MKLNSKIAIVTGASRGLGKATVLALVEHGVKVYGLARSGNRLSELQQACGTNFIPVEMDLQNRETLIAWISETFSAENAPDILINNAGAGIFGKIDELPLKKWQTMIDTNLNAVFYLTAAIVPLMKQRETSKHIINIGSILGKTSGGGKSGYSATKYAIQGFSEALFKELRGDNIKVTCVNPGSIDTHFFEESGVEANPQMLQPTEVAEVLIHILESPDNLLIDELTLRPLNPKR